MDASFIRIPANESDDMLRDVEVIRRAIARSEGDLSRHLDVGDAWAAAHFLLSGETPIPRHEALRRGGGWDDNSLENVIMGGEPTPLGDTNGPARFLSPSHVSKLAKRLSRLDVDQTMRLYRPEELLAEQIPPGDWEDPERKAQVRDAVTRLVPFFAAAAANGDGILIRII